MARKIELKTRKVGTAEFRFIDQLISFASSGIGSDGLTMTEMFEAQPIVQKLKAHDDANSIILEEAEWLFLRARVEAGRYPALHDVWIEFISAVRNAEQVQIAEVAKEA